MADRYAMRAATRAAAVALLRDYARSEVMALNVYRARPTNIETPHAFIDGLTERIVHVGIANIQRTVSARVVILYGRFDGGDAADQSDRFVDGFVAWVANHHDAAGPNTEIREVTVADTDTFTPDWLPPDRQTTYFASVITLEGYAET